MRHFFLPRFAHQLAALAGMAAAMTALPACAALETGERPAASTQPVAVAADVKFIDANGLRFAYLEAGNGPLVLLLHGYPETARSWTVVQRRLAEAGYRVVAPYARGYAPSAIPADGMYSVASLGQDVLALINALGSQSAIVVGHDWGALAAYGAATVQPDKVSRLVAISVPHPRSLAGDKSFFIAAPHFVYYQSRWAERLLWSHDFAHIERVYQDWAPHYTPPREVIDEVKATLRSPGVVEAALGYYRAVRKEGGLDRRVAELPITVPSLVIAGRADGLFGTERYEQARAAFTGPYRQLMLDRVGHFPQLEAPQQTAEAILAFIAESH